MSSAKYQRAPQEEPLDEDYTQAPPAYDAGPATSAAAAAPHSNDETRGLFGAPRSSEDNLPDDFKVCGLPPRPERWMWMYG